jgi:MFS transporter, AAHS family, 4-hydroxybenzoate transporter
MGNERQMAGYPAAEVSPGDIKPMSIDAGEIIDGQSRNGLRATIAVLTFMVMFVDGFDLNLLGYIAPALMKQFDVGKPEFGSVVSAGLVGYMIGAFLLGDLGDRFGRRRLIISGVVLFGLATLAGALITSVPQLVVLRLLAGIGLGGAIPNAIALNAEYSPARARATGIGIMFVGYSLGGAAPGWMAPWLLPSYGWQAIFVVGGALPIIIAVLLGVALPESIRFLASRHPRDPELFRLLSRLRPDLALTAGGAFHVQEEVKSGMPLRHLFGDGRAPITLLLWLAFIANLMALLFIISWTPTVLAGNGFPAERAALLGAMFQTGGAFGSLLISYFVDRLGAKAIWLSFAAAAACVASIGLLLGVSEIALVVLLFVSGLFATGGQIGLNALAGTFYPTFIRATGVGSAFGIGRIGSILGPIAGGLLLATHMPIAPLFVCAALPFIVAGVAIAGLNGLRSRDTKSTALAGEPQ